MAVFDAVRALGTWRWLAVPPAFLVGGWLGADHAEFVTEVLARAQGDPNFWDGALVLPTNKYAIVFGFVLGFVLVTGDLYVQDLHVGTAYLTLLRSRSRAGWWAGKILSLAPAALLYSMLAYVFALAGSALVLPIKPGPSRAAEIPWGSETALYPRFEGMPMPLFCVLVVLYTAFALWALGSLVITASALYSRGIVPLVAGLALVIVGSRLEEPFVYRQGAALLNPVYHVTYVTHFSSGDSFALAPWLYAVGVLGGMLFVAVAVGAWWVSRTDV